MTGRIAGGRRAGQGRTAAAGAERVAVPVAAVPGVHRAQASVTAVDADPARADPHTIIAAIALDTAAARPRCARRCRSRPCGDTALQRPPIPGIEWSVFCAANQECSAATMTRSVELYVMRAPAGTSW
jgi:hypothetical protein